MTQNFTNPFSLHGKRVLVTGASGGIGHAVAVQSALAGAIVVLTGRDQRRLDETLAQLDGSGHCAVQADLADPQQVETLVEQSGPINGVVHCAGVNGVMPIRLVTKTYLDRVFAGNFHAPVLLTQRLLYKKKLRDGASILFLSSISAHTGTVGIGPYSASKAALEGVMQSLALEVAPRAMRVNALAPGLVDTPLVNFEREWLDEKSKMYPLGISQPEEVGNAAVYFLADASRKITGSTLHMDGGIAWT